MSSSTVDFYNGVASRYSAEERLSHECAIAICQEVAKYILPSLDSLVLLDVGGGSGYFEALLLGLLSKLHLINLDLSPNMLSEAQEVLSECGFESRVDWVQGNAYNLPFQTHSLPYLFMSYTFHLLNSSWVLPEISRVLSRRGRFFLVTYAQDDLRSDVYHANFPGLLAINSERFVSLRRLTTLLEARNLEVKSVLKYPSTIRYDSVDEVLQIVRDRPFSALSTDFYSLEEFRHSCAVFEERLNEAYGSGPLISKRLLTLVTCMGSANG